MVVPLPPSSDEAREREGAGRYKNVRVLAVGDPYMPVRFFREALAALADDHDVDYAELETDADFVPSTASERGLREFLGSPRQLLARMAGVEVLLVQGAPVTDAVLDASERLRLVGCARGGPLNVDVEAANARGIAVVNTPGKNAEAVADLTLALMVTLARVLPRAQRFLAQGNQVRDNWDGAQFFGSDLRGRTLGLVGYGQIGRRVAARARAFGVEMIAYDPFQDAIDVARAATLEELLSVSDFVSLHARATADNARLIDAAALARMKPGAFLINTARESLVDQPALDAALASGHLGGAALDVFEQGRPGELPELLRHDNVVLTPHLGGATVQTLQQGAQMLADELRRLAAGEPLLNVVNAAAVRA
jgi:D-3-phosphoglycerate dehydrogenase / 2-oxoglutarate reductase